MPASNNVMTGTTLPLYQDYTAADYDKLRELMAADPGNKDAFFEYVYKNTYKTSRATSIANKAPLSLGNRYALFTWFGLHGDPETDISKFYRDNIEGGNIVSPKESREITTQKIIDYFNNKNLGGIEYTWSDFLWAKYHKKIPNNHLLTLRRFAAPCEDNIYRNIKTSLPEGSTDYNMSIESNITAPDLSRAVTWMDEATGNNMDEILSFTYGYNWKEQTAETNTLQSEEGGYTAQPFYSKFGAAGASLFDTMKGITPGEKYRRQRTSGHDILKETYENFVIGPVNVVNKMQTRDVGLNFDSDLKIKFQYELKSYSGINPKVAFLDIFANLLVLTYSNANFWGGANRFYGANGFVTSRFGDWQKLAAGDFKGYLGTVVNDLSGGFKNVFGDQETGGYTVDSTLAGFQDVGGVFLGNMLGSFLNKQIGAAPAFQVLKGFITGEPTGNWHLTVGNPINPIAMFGNLILKDSNIKFEGPLGYDDFPSIISLECTLAHARPRDKSDFESAFNAGKGRLYASAEGFADVLNLEGKDVDSDGAFQGKKKATGKGTGGRRLGDDGSIVTSRDAERGFRYGATAANIDGGVQNSAVGKTSQFSNWTGDEVSNYIASNELFINR